MIILCIRTDKPEAELYVMSEKNELARSLWMAHRQLSDTIHDRIEKVIAKSGYKLHKVDGLVLYRGPGSFTGLRIGASVANALAGALDVGIVGASGADWVKSGIARLEQGQNDGFVVPEYGSEARTTQQKK